MRFAGRLAVVLAFAVALVVPAAPAFGATVQASGAFTEGPVENERSLGFVGNAEVFALERDVSFTGTYTGDGRAHQTIAIREDGSALFHITIQFTGTACGEPATLVFQIAGRGDLFAGELSGHYVVLDGGKVRGTGRFVGVPNVGGEYEGREQCR